MRARRSAAARRTSLYAALAAVTAAAAACAPDRVTAPDADAPSLAIAPPAGIATGVSIDGAPLGRTGMGAWDAWTTQVGRRPLYVMWYADWSTSFQGFALTNAYGRGATPIVTWEMKNRRTPIPYADVLAGRWNKYIDAYAAAARQDGRPLFLRFGHEMNGDWYGWSGARNGASAAAAQQFVQTWVYVRGRFAKAGATNVTWVWCPNHESVPDAPWNAPANYYPGDAQVDWICVDGYNWGTSQTQATGGWDSRWQTFDEVFAPAYARLAAIAPTKPLMIGEFASTETGGSKAAWIADAAARMRSGAYPQLRAFVWFDYDKETDWRVASSAGSLGAFRQAFTSDSRFVWAAGR